MYGNGSKEGLVVAEYDLIIKDGTIVNGTRTPRFVGDIGIKDGRIAQIGGLRRSQASRVLDASGLIVAPGFVDLHTHYDAQVQWDPYCTISGWHGVTTVVIGNCGFGFAPCREEDRERAMLTLTRNEAIPLEPMKIGMLWDWISFPEFLDSLDRIPKGLNLASYVPLTPLYVWTMGAEAAKSRRPNEDELRKMSQLMHEGMDAGACGWSAQVMGPYSVQRDYDGTPMITDLMANEEILTFARVLAERDEGSIELTYRATDDQGRPLRRQMFDLYEDVAKTSGRPVLYQSVVITTHDPEQHREMLRWLEDCAHKGVPVYAQGETSQTNFEFTFEDWNLFDNSPTWTQVTLGSPAERKTKMQDPQLRAALRAEWDGGLRPGIITMDNSLEGLIVTEVGQSELERYVGLRVGDIAAQEGKHVVDALLDLAVADDLRTEFLSKRMVNNPEYVAEALHSPYLLPGLSDGGAHVKFSVFGSYPTETLTWLVRDQGALTLEEAHYKLSYLPAFLGGIRDRGILLEGLPADIVVYDLQGLNLLPAEIAHDLPGGDWRRIQRAEGYRWILVNGQVTFQDGEPTGVLPGRLLRHGRG